MIARNQFHHVCLLDLKDPLLSIYIFLGMELNNMVSWYFGWNQEII